MTLDEKKVEVELARNQMNKKDLAERAGMSSQRLNVLLNSKRITAKTAGKIANALLVDVLDVIKQEGNA